MPLFFGLLSGYHPTFWMSQQTDLLPAIRIARQPRSGWTILIGSHFHIGDCGTRLHMPRNLQPAKGFGGAGRRRVTLSHVSCAPSSNWTCGFPASSSPAIFFRRRAPQARQRAHPSRHWVQPAPCIQELVVPALPGRPPTAVVFAPAPQWQLTQHGPVDRMEDPVAVAGPEIGARKWSPLSRPFFGSSPKSVTVVEAL